MEQTTANGVVKEVFDEINKLPSEELNKLLDNLQLDSDTIAKIGDVLGVGGKIIGGLGMIGSAVELKDAIKEIRNGDSKPLEEFAMKQVMSVPNKLVNSVILSLILTATNPLAAFFLFLTFCKWNEPSTGFGCSSDSDDSMSENDFWFQYGASAW